VIVRAKAGEAANAAEASGAITGDAPGARLVAA
jgi:hypothetical protein